MKDNFSQLAFSNRSSHTRFELFFLRSKEDRNKTGLHRFKPNSCKTINWRTVKPFKTAAIWGCFKSTSRSQTCSLLRTLEANYSVIPLVPLIWWITYISSWKVRSLKQTFVFAWVITLAIKQIFTFTRKNEIFQKNLLFVLLCYNFKEIRPK